MTTKQAYQGASKRGPETWLSGASSIVGTGERGAGAWEGGGPVVAPTVLAFRARQAINLFICGLHKTWHNVCPFSSRSLLRPPPRVGF